jgi:hypothetical protein
MSCDLENAYLNAKGKEKIWFEGGIECGANQGKVLIVFCALYGLKSAGASWCVTLVLSLLQQILMFGFKRWFLMMDLIIRRCCLYM